MANLKETIDAIREAINHCDAGERELYDELMSEAEGWRMRLREIEDDE